MANINDQWTNDDGSVALDISFDRNKITCTEHKVGMVEDYELIPKGPRNTSFGFRRQDHLGGSILYIMAEDSLAVFEQRDRNPGPKMFKRITASEGWPSNEEGLKRRFERIQEIYQGDENFPSVFKTTSVHLTTTPSIKGDDKSSSAYLATTPAPSVERKSSFDRSTVTEGNAKPSGLYGFTGKPLLPVHDREQELMTPLKKSPKKAPPSTELRGLMSSKVNSSADYFIPGLVASASFMLALMSLKKFRRFLKPMRG